MILIIIPNVILDITLTNGILPHVNHYVLVIGHMMKKLIHAIMNTFVLKRSIMIHMLMLVLAGTLLNAMEINSLTVLVVNVKFLVLYGLKKITGVIVLKIISTIYQ